MAIKTFPREKRSRGTDVDLYDEERDRVPPPSATPSPSTDKHSLQNDLRVTRTDIRAL